MYSIPESHMLNQQVCGTRHKMLSLRACFAFSSGAEKTHLATAHTHKHTHTQPARSEELVAVTSFVQVRAQCNLNPSTNTAIYTHKMAKIATSLEWLKLLTHSVVVVHPTCVGAVVLVWTRYNLWIITFL